MQVFQQWTLSMNVFVVSFRFLAVLDEDFVGCKTSTSGLHTHNMAKSQKFPPTTQILLIAL
jgi:hypothetical protein